MPPQTGLRIRDMTAAFALLAGLMPSFAAAAHSFSSKEFRSAYLNRDVTRQDHSLAQERAEIRRHFDRVLQILEARQQESLDTALTRLEARQDVPFTADERASWRARLEESRQRQIAQLRVYRDRGSFPRNEGQAVQAVPIFVDSHNTACAVGYLMRQDGWEGEVQQIAETNNFVFVPEVESGPLRDWVLTSGLTQEEAALIQPSYFFLPPEADTDLATLIETDADPALDGHGVLYSNFEYSARNFEMRLLVPPTVCETDPERCQRIPVLSDNTELPEPQNIGIAALTGDFTPSHGPFGGLATPYKPDGTHWIVIGARDPSSPTQGAIDSRTSLHEAQSMEFRFDVTTASPLTQITAVHIADEPSICLGCGRGPSYAIGAEVFVGSDSIGIISIQEELPGETEPGGLLTEKTLTIPPQQQLHIEAALWNQDHTFTNAMLVEVTVEPVPEWIPGDADLDGAVAANDLQILLSNFGAADLRTSSFVQGDTDLDDDVDGHDLMAALLHLGQAFPGQALAGGAQAASATAIPEPTASVLAIIMLVCGFGGLSRAYRGAFSR